MNWSKLGHFLVYWTYWAQIFLQTSPDISSQQIKAQYSFFYTVIPLNIKWSHINFAIQIMIFLKKFFNMFEKIILFCTSIYIWKLISQKTQNNFFSAQIIVPPPTMPWRGMKPLRISKFYMQICPTADSIGYVALILIKLLG